MRHYRCGFRDFGACFVGVFIMVVLKKINNNVAICKDSGGRELIAFGKGIGFPQTPYILTDLRKIERTFYNVSSQYIFMLNDIPYEIIQFTANQLLTVQDELPYETTSNLVLTLADHIAFAIERAQKGIYVRMPSIYEIELNYPAEVKIGRCFVSEIRKKFHVPLSKNEVQGIAMHLINAQDGAKLSEKVPEVEQFYDEILAHTTRIIEQELNVQVQQNTFNYARFATHIQYLLARALEHKQIDSRNLLMYQSVRSEFPKISDCVDKVSEYYRDEWALSLSEEEKLYLIMHVNRVCCAEK